MKLLDQRYFGSIARCECGAVIGYNIKDVYDDCYIYCPQCKNKIKILFSYKYDGLVREEKKDGTVL